MVIGAYFFMKKGKELNVKLNKKFKTYYGTIDNKELKTIYVGISTWATPIEEYDDYSFAISSLRQLIKNGVNQNINSQIFKADHHIIDIDIKDSRVALNKSSYLNIEITLFVKNQKSILTNLIRNDMIRFINGILATIEKSNYFEFTSSKIRYVPTT